MKTVLFFLPSDLIGGAETQTYLLARGLAGKGFKTVIAHVPVTPSGKPFIEKLRRTSAVFEITAEEDLVFVINKFKPDIIHHFHNARVHSALKRSGHKCKVVEVVHGRFHFPNDVTKTPKDLTNWVVSVSDDAQSFYLNSRPEWGDRTSVIPNGVDLDTLGPIAAARTYTGSTTVFAHLGRLCEGDKHLTKIVDACKSMGVHPAHWKLRIVGDGADRALIESYVKKEGAGLDIELATHTDSPEEVYKNADVYLSRSEAEGFGLSIAEAAATGLPIVMWDCGGVSRYFNNGKSACIVRSTQDFVASMEMLANSYMLRGMLGKNAAALAAAKFSDKVMVDAYVSLYAKLLGERIEVDEKSCIKRRIAGISNPNFSGVTNATKGVVGERWVAAPPIQDVYVLNAVTSKLAAINPDVLLVGGGGGHSRLIRHIKAKMPKTKIMLVWHGTNSFNSFAPGDAKILAEYILFLEAGYIDRIGFVRPGAHKVFGNQKIVHFPNRVPARMSPVKKALGDGLHIGVFGTPYAWKNQQGAALYLGKLSPQVTIHVNQLEEKSLLTRAGIKVVEHGVLPQNDFRGLLASMDLNAMLSFTESMGLAAIESYRVGVPCITSRNVRLTETIDKTASVCDLDDVDEIHRVAWKLINNKAEVVEAANKSLDALDFANARVIAEVINGI